MYQQTNSMEYSMAKKNLFGLQCACCGSDITAPQFYNGQMYGYTCITKVAPKQKKNKATKFGRHNIDKTHLFYKPQPI